MYSHKLFRFSRVTVFPCSSEVTLATVIRERKQKELDEGFFNKGEEALRKLADKGGEEESISLLGLVEERDTGRAEVTILRAPL